MKATPWTLMLAIAAAPAALLASTDTDHKIEEAAKDSYNFRTVLNGRVDAKADNGVVTLTGTVRDSDQRDLAQDTVADLPGVVSVDNEIKVTRDGREHSDDWIAVKIKSELLVHANVSATATKVEVADGVVTLSGNARNAAQKELTEMYAKGVDGVRDVRNDLVVAGDASASESETVGENIDDASIKGQLKFELASHKATSALRTKVDTEHGVVMITGEADSDAEKSLVTKLAQGIRGVRSVNNRMTVRP